MDRSGYMPATDLAVTAAVAGDEPAFAALTERHRRELHVHCYRMLASFDEAASALGTSVAAANSALQRARATMQAHLPQKRGEWSAREPSAEERALVEQFIAAHERFDAEAALAIAAKDIRVTMPPLPYCFDGPEAIRPLMAHAAEMGEWRLVPVGANRMAAAASYLRRPGDSQFRAFKLDVMRIEAGMIAEITTFNAELFAAFGLDPTL